MLISWVKWEGLIWEKHLEYILLQLLFQTLRNLFPDFPKVFQDSQKSGAAGEISYRKLRGVTGGQFLI